MAAEAHSPSAHAVGAPGADLTMRNPGARVDGCKARDSKIVHSGEVASASDDDEFESGAAETAIMATGRLEEDVLTSSLMAELHPMQMRKVLIEALQKHRYGEYELCRRLRRILKTARHDWGSEEGGEEGVQARMGDLVHFLVEHTKPKIFSALSPASQELWLSALRVLPPADSVKPAVAHEGYLFKKGKRSRMWQRRFYIVRYSSIFYYKNERKASYSLADEPRGIIDLSAVAVVKRLGPRDPPYHSKHCIALLGAGKNFFFKCDSQDDVAKWVAVLQQCVDNVEEIHRAVTIGSLEFAVPLYGRRRRAPAKSGGASGDGSDGSLEGESSCEDDEDEEADDARRAEHYHGMTPHAVMKDKTEKQEKMLLLLLLMRAIHRL